MLGKVGSHGVSRRLVAVLGLLCIQFGVPDGWTAAPAGWGAPAYREASQDGRGLPGSRDTNESSFDAALSANGRFVAFASLATNLLDDGLGEGIFVRDRQTGSTVRVSVTADGLPATDRSAVPALSADGRLVAFSSYATNLVGDDTNGASDVFVRDLGAGTTVRVPGSDGGYTPALSGDGRLVAFEGPPAPGGTWGAIYLHDRATGATGLASVATDGAAANHQSFHPALSADGRVLAFESQADNLAGNDANGFTGDVFVRDFATGQTTLVSVNAAGQGGNDHSSQPALSADGRWVAFGSNATDLVTGDGNGQADIFVHDRTSGTTTRVSVGDGGAEANGWSIRPAISADGRYVAFESTASNLVTGDTNGGPDVFVHDRLTGVTTRVSVASNGKQASLGADNPTLSANGRFVAFESWADDLARPDTNNQLDVFVHDRARKSTTRVSVARR